MMKLSFLEETCTENTGSFRSPVFYSFKRKKKKKSMASNPNMSSPSAPGFGTSLPKDEWGKSIDEAEFSGNDFTISNVRILDEENQKGLLFKALRGIHVFRSSTFL
jgi:hypothetical protein